MHSARLNILFILIIAPFLPNLVYSFSAETFNLNIPYHILYLHPYTHMRIRERVEIFTIKSEVNDMHHVKDAVVQRFQALCAVRNIRYNELAVRSGVTPSTVYSMMDPKRKDLSILTIKKLCDGLEITITEFFDDEIFLTLEQEIV